MKKVQRLAGKMGHRSADQADVGTVIAEFKGVDAMLDRMIKDLKLWRNQWDEVLRHQYDATDAFATLYKPIGSTDARYQEQRHRPTETPAQYMNKCLALGKLYSDMKADLQQELSIIDRKLVAPAEEARKAIKALHKTLKHRENMKLDYERYLSRAEHARKKTARSVKEEAALEQHESHLAQANIDYQTADDQVKQTFPPVTEAVLSLLPYLLAIQVEVQTTLVGQIYTSLDAYCKQQGLPSPAPSDAEIVSKWDGEFTSLRKELEEGITLLQGGKAMHQPMNVPEKDHSTYTGLGIRNKTMGLAHRVKKDEPPPRPGSTGRVDTPHHDEEEVAPVKPPRPGTMGSPAVSPGVGMVSKPGGAAYGYNAAPYDQKPSSLMPGHAPPPYSESAGGTPSPRYRTPSNGASPNAGYAGNDYFDSKDRRASHSSLASSAASIAAKKKPPPPVPVKRIPSQQGQYVTAMFDFDGQNAGDLAFREGDRIRVVKKTDSTDDWWDGELRGKVGSFPANYVEL